MDEQLLTDEDLALRPSGLRRAPWLIEALAAEGDPPPAQTLRGDARADVVIVGGGFTGLWTAWHLLERRPDLGVAILEADICGGGPSGRNGGFVNGWWDEADTLLDLHGADGARACLTEVSASVDAITSWCHAHGVDAHVRRGGMLVVSTTAAHDARLRGAARVATELGDPGAVRELDESAVAVRCRSPRFRGGLLIRDAATVHPGHLVRGLRHAVVQRGAMLSEGTRVRALRSTGDGVSAVTAGGTLRARQAVLAVNAWGAGWPQLRGSVLTWSSYMVRSEPVPDLVRQALGWTGGESIVDARFSVHYLHVTRDGRIAIGAGAGRPGRGGRIGSSFTDDLTVARRAAFAFRWLFPALRDVRLTDAWGGPIDVGPDHLPRVWSTDAGRVHATGGYSGNGVAPSHLVGRILAGLVLRTDEPVTRLPIVRRPDRRFPPEPIRFIGARILRAALVRREDLEESGRRPPRLLRALTRLPRLLGYRLGPAD